MAMSRHCFLSVFKDYTVYTCPVSFKRLFDLLQTNLFLPDVQKKHKKLAAYTILLKRFSVSLFPKPSKIFWRYDVSQSKILK